MSFQVQGRVYEAESGSGLANLWAKAFDKDLIEDDGLGETSTDSKGYFEIQYSKQDFNDWVESNPDLYLVVKTPNRSRVLPADAHGEW